MPPSKWKKYLGIGNLISRDHERTISAGLPLEPQKTGFYAQSGQRDFRVCARTIKFLQDDLNSGEAVGEISLLL
jgi:hypothetical protein